MIKKLLIILGIVFLVFYILFFQKANVENEYTLKLNESKDFLAVEKILDENHVISNYYIYDLIKLFYSIHQVPMGNYRITKSMTSLDILRKLKYGQQDPIRFTLSTATFVQDIAGKVGNKMGFDSAEFLKVLWSEENKNKFGYDTHSALSLFIPNTYEFYWTTTPQFFLEKWVGEHKKFWNEERIQKAKNLNLSPLEAYTLASLVQKEYMRKDERSRIAGVLINRLKMNMPLQVNATCKYATRDFLAKRVLNFHTSFPSLYNTYQHTGLPPGPICVPEISTIDAILDPENHDYIFYCADPSLNGYHIFSKTSSEHLSVAQTYHRKWMK